MENLGLRLRKLRQESGLTLREFARQVDVSPSFVSQIENGKSQPSVASLYVFAQRLNVSVDRLFGWPAEDDSQTITLASHQGAPEAGPADPAHVWQSSEVASRISVVHPTHRAQLGMADGVVWERLAATPEQAVSFMKIVYAPGACSADGGELAQHDGYEYGYVTAGQLEVSVGAEVFVLGAGESLGFDSSIPHVFRNPGEVEMQGIWFVHGNARRN